MRENTNKEAVAGIMLLGLGLFFMIYSLANYRLGTLQQMGPGMFPTLMGGLLSLLGALNLLQSRRFPDRRPFNADQRSLVTIIGAIVLFGLTVNVFGVIPAVAIMLVPAMLASTQIRLLEGAAIILVMCFVVYLVFGVLLRLPLHLFRWPF